MYRKKLHSDPSELSFETFSLLGKSVLDESILDGIHACLKGTYPYSVFNFEILSSLSFSSITVMHTYRSKYSYSTNKTYLKNCAFVVAKDSAQTYKPYNLFIVAEPYSDYIYFWARASSRIKFLQTCINFTWPSEIIANILEPFPKHIQSMAMLTSAVQDVSERMRYV